VPSACGCVKPRKMGGRRAPCKMKWHWRAQNIIDYTCNCCLIACTWWFMLREFDCTYTLRVRFECAEWHYVSSSSYRLKRRSVLSLQFWAGLKVIPWLINIQQSDVWIWPKQQQTPVSDINNRNLHRKQIRQSCHLCKFWLCICGWTKITWNN